MWNDMATARDFPSLMLSFSNVFFIYKFTKRIEKEAYKSTTIAIERKSLYFRERYFTFFSQARPASALQNHTMNLWEQ